jgi:hypothetical protein
MFTINLNDSFVDSNSELNNLAGEQNNSAEQASCLDQNDLDCKKQINLNTDDAINDTIGADEERTHYFKFKISNDDLKLMIAQSIKDKNPLKPFRYLTGNFMRPFEKQIELIEGESIPIQKRNNIVYVEASRNNTVYLRINGDCKLCPKISRVRYVFTIRNRPEDHDKLVEIEARRKGLHSHSTLGAQPKGAQHINHSTERNLLSMRSRTNAVNGSIPHTRKLISHLIKSKNERPKKRKICEYDSKLNTSQSKNLNGVSEASYAQSVMLTTAINSTQPSTISSLTNPILNGASLPIISTSTSSYSSPPGPGSASSSSSMPGQQTQIDKHFLQQLATQIATQITSKLMIKLDQINLKINAINDKLYDMERKLDNLESQSDIII